MISAWRNCEVNIERIFIINKPKSREHNSEVAEDPEIPYVLTPINNELTNVYGFRPVSLIKETAVVGNTTKVSLSVKPVTNGVDDDNLKEVNSVRRSPVAGSVTEALERGGSVRIDPVVGNMTEAFTRAGGVGDQQENPYQEISTGCSILTRVKESSAGGQQENSYQQTLTGKGSRASTITTEVLKCDEGVRRYVTLDRNALANVEKNRAGDQQENSYQEIPSGKSRAENIQTAVRRIIVSPASMTDNDLTFYQSHDESASDDSGSEHEIYIKKVQFFMSKANQMTFYVDDTTKSYVDNTIESYIDNTMESYVDNKTKFYVDNTTKSYVDKIEKPDINSVMKSDANKLTKPYPENTLYQNNLPLAITTPIGQTSNLENPLPTIKKNQILTITSVEYSRDQLLMRKDNIAHFMSVDCEISTPICQQLVDLEMINIERLKTELIGVAAIVQTNLSKGKIIYSLFIKEKSNEVATTAIIVQCLVTPNCNN